MSIDENITLRSASESFDTGVDILQANLVFNDSEIRSNEVGDVMDTVRKVSGSINA